MDEASMIIEGYGAKKLSPNRESLRRKSAPMILFNKQGEWPVLFGGTPNIDSNSSISSSSSSSTDENNSEELVSRPRSRTTTTPPDGSLPLIYEKQKITFTIGKKKKFPARRLSLPPILEGDHHSELVSSPIVLNKPQPTLSPVQPSQQPVSKLNSPRSNNLLIPAYKSPLPKQSTNNNQSISSPCSVSNPPLNSD